MDDGPGPSKRTKSNYDRKKKLTEEELLAVLDESDSEAEPFENDSDDDPNYSGSTTSNSSESEEEAELEPQRVRPLSPAPLSQALPAPSQSDSWIYDDVPCQNFSFTKKTGLLVNVNNFKPIDYFHLLATDEFFDMLCTRANNHAIDLLSRSAGEEPRISRWNNVTSTEIKKFLGLLFHMGTIRLNRINDYWKKHNMFNLQCFSAFMSRNRFLLILRVLQFENTENGEPPTQMGKIVPLINFFNNKMAEIYYPTRELSIDESMILWRGRLKFRQYIKGKRHKFGIKLYVLCEPNGLAAKIIVYAGSSDAELSGAQHTQKVVLALLAGKLDNGHSIYMDNFYNSIELTKELLQRKTYVTGTLRSNRKNNPTDVVKKNLKKGELVAQHNSQGICVVKWKDRREILAISSEYNAELQNVTSHRGQQKRKPTLINKYNEFMAGVDHCDQMLSYYSCEHKTLIWYKKLGIHVFQMMLLNSYYLYKRATPNNGKSFYDYRLCVIENLLGPKPPQPLPKIRITHLPEFCPKGEGATSRIKRRRCQVCWEQERIRKDSIFYCPLCPGQPGLCLSPCFRTFHSNK